MKKTTTSQSGFFNPRIFASFLLVSAGMWLGMFSFAAIPPTGTVSDTGNLVVSYDAGPFNVANATPVTMVDVGPECHAGGAPGGETIQPCDDFALTATISSAYLAAHPNAAIKVTASWNDTGSGNSDYDLYVFKNPRPDCNPTDCSATNGTQQADFQAASGNNPEITTISGLVAGTQKFTIVVVPYTPTGETVHVTMELVEGGAGGGGGGGGPFGGADPTVPGNPRYQVFFAPTGSSAESTSGEFNIGFNPATGHIMTMNLGPIWRLTTPENLTPALPECCEALWQDRSSGVTDTGLDPILWTDQVAGRTFASNSTAGANGLYAYSDNDGDLWLPIGGAPVSGADHQTIGTGRYPDILPFNIPGGLRDPANTITHGQYVLYCSQTLVGSLCQRSDTFGNTYGPGIPATGPGTSNSQGCGGLHGHVHVAPDGTAWLPDKSCGTQQGGGISVDADAAPWTEFSVSGTNDLTGQPFTTKPQTDGADPSIALDADSTAYYCYVNDENNSTEGHVHVAVGQRVPGTTTINWIRDVDVGLSHGIKNAAHPEAVGGSSGRAACGFFGTDKSGNYQAENFAGKWYPFIATTYDQGRTWVTVNASPNDPAQSMTGIWQQGGGEQDRNLLDFNEITVDNKGRVLYGFSDGCTSAGCIDGSAPNDYTAFMRVARQSGGKSIFASFDTPEPVTPKPPCLSGTRSATESLLTWKAPDNGGADVTNYLIFRSNTAGNEVQIGQTGDGSTSFRDQNPPADVHLFYRVLAMNSQGPGPLSNEIDLVATPPLPPQSACNLPGITLLTDPLGDTSSALGLTQTPAPPGSDLAAFNLAQPYQADGIPRLVFTINTDPNPTGIEPPGWAAYVAMKIVSGATTTYKGVLMKFTTGTPIFESYTPSPSNSGGVDGRFVMAGSETPAEPGSNYNAAGGVITIIVKASDLGLAPGNTIAGFVSGTEQSSDPFQLGAGVSSLYDQMPDSLTFAGSYTVAGANACGLLSAVSRRTHGAAGPFDIPLPLTGTVAVEPRIGPFTLVLTLGSTVTAPGTVTVTPSGSGTATIGSDSHQVIVTLTGIPNAQHVFVTLNGVVASGVTLNNLTVPIDVLFGDVNSSKRTDNADSSTVRRNSVSAPTATTFRSDVNVSGRIDNSDVNAVRRASVTGLP